VPTPYVPLPLPVPVPGPRRYPNQTCENNVLDHLQAEMHAVCDAISGGSCSEAKVSPKRLSRRPCSTIRISIQQRRDCIALRERLQDICFAGKPDATHADALKMHKDGLTQCLKLEAVNCAPGHPMADL